VVVLLTGCELEDQTSIMMLEGSSTGSTINNFTNNITNNITTINNFTTTLSVQEPNSSYQCSNINQRLYNVTKINGALSGLCGTDEGITTEQDLIALSAAVVQNTSTWLAINARTLYPGISNFTLTQFQTQNDSIWTAINARTLYPGISNFTLAQFQAQNTTIWSAIQATGISNFTLGQFQVQNTSLWTAINSKALPFANSSTQCSGTDKLTNITSLNGLITGICSADQTGGGSPASYSLLSSFQNITDWNSQDRGYECWTDEQFTTSTTDKFMKSGNLSGTAGYGSGYKNRPGVMTLNTASTGVRGSGFATYTMPQAFLLNGSETTQTIFSIPQPLGLNNTIFQMGFSDSQSARLTVANGVYLECTMNGTVGAISNRCWAKVRNNNAEINNSITTSLNFSTWYDMNITIYQPSGATTLWANFTIYNETGFVFWNVNISQGIPSITGREVGAMIWAWRNTPASTAQKIMDLDYQEVCIKRRLVR
jgi:hypothetical protein